MIGPSPENEQRGTLAACLLLAGGPRLSPLVAETGCSVLDLSLTASRTVLGLWFERLTEICPLSGRRLQVRIVHDERTPEPVLVSDAGPLEVRVGHEQRSFRGPAGIAKDECADLGENDTVLLVEAGRLAVGSLRPMLARHAAMGADITVGSNPDGSTSGIYLLRVGSLSLAPKNGFMDLKEQWLQKALRAGLDVRVFQFPTPGALLLRTRQQFLEAARLVNGFPDPVETMLISPENPELRGRDGRSVVSKSATIAAGAVVVDSVVMDEATVAAGAVVARSLVCPRAVVGPNATVLDGVVTRNGIGLSVETANRERGSFLSSIRSGDRKSQ